MFGPGDMSATGSTLRFNNTGSVTLADLTYSNSSGFTGFLGGTADILITGDASFEGPINLFGTGSLTTQGTTTIGIVGNHTTINAHWSNEGIVDWTQQFGASIFIDNTDASFTNELGATFNVLTTNAASEISNTGGVPGTAAFINLGT